MTWDPGPGWVEVERRVAAQAPEAVLHRGRGHVVRAWIPVEDLGATPLPTG